ncbi:hypothetical protein BGW41_000665 [Actinomortierella wolfii]|nr:hypothetical protein BGW41_000665 [Actinomortierella wolfii]
MGNPQAVFTKRYHPTVTEYEPACNRFDVNTPDRTYSVLPNNGCATISFYPFAIDLKSNLTRIYTVRGSAERVRVVIPRLANAETHKLVPNTVADVGLSVRVDYGDEACMTPNKKYLVLDATRTGITSSPMTAITKCLLKTGESIILSTSAIRFLAPSNKQFHAVATSLFGTQDELVQAMEDSVNNSTLTTLPANALEELVILEIETTNTEVVALMCIWARQSVAEAPHIACAYTITSVLITKPLRMNPSIAQQLVNKGLNPSDSPITAIMTLSHLPQASTNRVSYNIPKILKEAEAATRYIASLGNNFVVDWEGSALYVMFDTFEILKGYDVPRWFFIAVIAAMVVCFILWFGTETLLNARYRESLYVAVSKELVGGKHAKPRLHRFNPRTLLFDGQYPLVASTSQIDTMGVDSEADRPFDEKTPIDTLPQHFIH